MINKMIPLALTEDLFKDFENGAERQFDFQRNAPKHLQRQTRELGRRVVAVLEQFRHDHVVVFVRAQFEEKADLFFFDVQWLARVDKEDFDILENEREFLRLISEFGYLHKDQKILEQNVNELGLTRHERNKRRRQLAQNSAIQSFIFELPGKLDNNLGRVKNNRRINMRQSRQHPVQNIFNLSHVVGVVLEERFEQSQLGPFRAIRQSAEHLIHDFPEVSTVAYSSNSK